MDAPDSANVKKTVNGFGYNQHCAAWPLGYGRRVHLTRVFLRAVRSHECSLPILNAVVLGCRTLEETYRTRAQAPHQRMLQLSTSLVWDSRQPNRGRLSTPTVLGDLLYTLSIPHAVQEAICDSSVLFLGCDRA